MKKFQGFTGSETFTPLPDSFFQNLLTGIEDLNELKVTLFALWRIGKMEGTFHFMREEDFSACLPEGSDEQARRGLQTGLEKAVSRGSLLQAASGDEVLYFLNSPRGRAAADSFVQGKWQPDATGSIPPLERPNIFKLYEENIGPLTPLIADALKDAERTYKPEWVAEALEIAVKNNKRNWRYVEAILKRWKEEGHAKKQDRRNAQEDGRRYTEGEFADFIEH